MAVIYPKNTIEGVKNMLVLDPRQALIYPFDIGNDWNTMRFGMIVSLTTSGDYNADLGPTPIPYVVGRNNPYNEYYLGLKRQGTGFATTDGDYYLGFRSSPDDPNTNLYNGAVFNRGAFGVWDKNGIMADAISTYNSSFTIGEALASTGQSAFAAIFSCELKVLDKGLTTQRFEMRSMSSVGYDTIGNSVAKEYLYQTLTHSTYAGNPNTSGTFAFNQGGVPFELPNAFFLYIPQVNARLRIHNLGVIKVD